MKPILVKYRNETFDISSFIHKHPGGVNTLKGLDNTDMTSRFLKGPPHSDAAMYLMREYRVGGKNHLSNNNEGEHTKLDDSMEVCILFNGTLTFQNKWNANMKPILVKYRNETFDISSFIHKHPGGVNTLKGLDNTDMTSRFLKGPPHSDAAMYLMREYRVGGKNHLSNNNEGEHTKLDDSMEHLVDWDKAMLPQIKNIAEYYDEWVHKPVDRELRLFDAWYLEILSKTPWWIVALFWTPIISYIAISELIKLQLQTAIFKFLAGIAFWTFLEYSLHRFLFHMNVSKANGIGCTLHFLLHGLHHKVPFDSGRLVFPPFPAVIIATIIYYPLSFIYNSPRMILAGGLFGYLCYDLMHYYLHYGNPTFWHMYQMKRYHYQHHFTHQDLGYGISSPLWDLIFGTTIRLRTLKNKLKWK